MIYRFIRPLLFCLPPEWVHSWSILFVRIFYKTPNKLLVNLPNNPVGLAAGLDKNARAINQWFNLGFGFIEIGAVTPKPQPGNPKPRVFRLPQYHALINRFGFNNRGVNDIVKRLRKSKYKHKYKQGSVGVNLGKNATTPLTWALDDYRYGLTKVYSYADFVTINISSPNTANLRDLQEISALRNLLIGLIEQKFLLEQYWQRQVPLYIKISPDLSDQELESICELVLELGIEGIIAANTTLSRHGIQGADERGGLSGPPLFERALSLVARVRKLTGSNVTIIGVGGVSCADDVKKMLAAGADLVQLYTALIYHGPGLIKQIHRELNYAGFTHQFRR